MARVRSRPYDRHGAALGSVLGWVMTGLALLGPTRVRAQQTVPVPSPLVFDGVTVVDVARGKLIPGQRVTIVGQHIQAMGKASAVKVPPGAQLIDAKGKYLIPGLWDMHAHVGPLAVALGGDGPEVAYPLFIANGVTGIRQMTGPGRTWRQAITAGSQVGPRIVGADTTNDIDRWGSSVARARQGVDTFKAAGAEFVKVHNVDQLPPAIYFAIAARAREIGMPLVGHLPNTITEIEASDSGQRTVEHFNEIHCWWPDGERGVSRSRMPASYPLPDSAGISRCTEMAKAFARNGTWFVPTLTMTHAQWDTLPARWPRWLRDNARAGHGDAIADPTVDQAHTIMRLFHRTGVPMLAGTDEPGFDGLLPGFSLLTELAFLVDDAGMTPLEALRAATLNPAQYLHATDSLGAVAPGKLADLVLLDADPLANITNTAKIRAVVANGRYFDRAELDRLLTGRPANARSGP